MSAVLVLLIGFAGIAIFSAAVIRQDRREQEDRRGWRLRYKDFGTWIYEEKQNDKWAGFEMPELTDYREPTHHLEIMGAARWSEYPTWCEGRREEILTRIRSELREPDYVLLEV